MVARRRFGTVALAALLTATPALVSLSPAQAAGTTTTTASTVSAGLVLPTAAGSGRGGIGSKAPRYMRAAPPVEARDSAARDLVGSAAENRYYRGSSAGAKASGSRAKARARYKVKQGVTFNNPIGSAKAKFRIMDHILEAVDNAPRGSIIRVMSWNIMSRVSVDRLLAAQKRGVVVRVLMDKSNLVDVPNPFFTRLRAGFKAENGRRGKPKEKRSYAKTCDNSCRGTAGQAHAKFYTFSQAGRSSNIVMQGSANLTTAMAINQWNDIYTWAERQDLYDFTTAIFDQMWSDTPADPAWATITSGKDSLWFSPYTGAGFPGDPVENLLSQVQCRGAVSPAGNKFGRTVIRVAPDVMRNPRGLRTSTRLKQLWDQGCDVQIAYTVLGMDSMQVLRGSGGRGPVPLRHLVQDFDRDREFDNYFHLKAISINGVVGTDPAAYWVVNGSSNLSGNATFSDENIGILNRKAATIRYQKFISYWFKNQPPFSGPGSGSDGARGPAAMVGPVDPYASVDMD